MNREELLDALVEISVRCGRGAAYDIREAADAEDYSDSEAKQKIRDLIEEILCFSLPEIAETSGDPDEVVLGATPPDYDLGWRGGPMIVPGDAIPESITRRQRHQIDRIGVATLNYMTGHLARAGLLVEKYHFRHKNIIEGDQS